jgi:thiol-disulfide isomerase/thioredoxin
MKKLLTALFALFVLCAVASLAFANMSVTLEMPEEGFRLHFPESFQEFKGTLTPANSFPLNSDGDSYSTFMYIGMSDEEMNSLIAKLNEGDESAEAALMAKVALPISILRSDKGNDPERIKKLLKDELEATDEDLATFKLAQIATVDNAIFYLDISDDEIPEFEEPFASEYKQILEQRDAIIKASEFFAPVVPYADMVGQVVSFETKDLDGNPVKSEELFAKNDVTMINIWGSFCPPCKEEMPALEKLNKEMAGKKAAVVGILGDGIEEQPIKDGKDFLAQNNITFLNLLPPENMDEVLPVEAYPTSFFVNSKGEILCPPIIGADTESYGPTIESFLSK